MLQINTFLTYYGKNNITFLYNKYYTIHLFFSQFNNFLYLIPGNLIYKFNKYSAIGYFLCLSFYKKPTWRYLMHTVVPYWTKINFRGKGFRVRKFRKLKKITFNFGRSHWTKLRFLKNNYNLIKIKRQIYVLTVYRKTFYQKLSSQLRLIKPINHYTKRGLRLKRQYIKKRFGKVSQVISSLQF